MGQTALQLIQAACYEANIDPPSALVGETASSTLQLLHLFYATGRELRQAKCWAQLKKKHTIYLQAGRSRYHLPQDFYAALPMTHWDRANSWEASGPLSDSAFDYRLYGVGASGVRRAYRVFGTDINPNSSRGQLEITPTPGDGDQDARITFEYVTRSWLTPALWVPGGTVTGTAYVSCSGNIYNHASGTTNGTVPPNMAFGEGQDGGVFWLALTTSAWAGTTLYAPGDYRTTGGRLYKCTVGGTSSGSAPTSTTEGVDITDGTVTWRYFAAASWAGETDFEEGEHILITAQYYRCTQGGKTGKVQPTWTATTVSDGTITWTHKEAAYEALIADTDLCQFDDELMIAGLKWRFLRSKNLPYGDLRVEYEMLKNSAAGRHNVGRVLSLTGNYRDPYGANVPDGSWTMDQE